MMSMGKVAESRGQPSTRRVPSPFGSRLQRAVTGAILFASAPEAASHCAAFEVVRSGSGIWILEMEKKKESRRAPLPTIFKQSVRLRPLLQEPMARRAAQSRWRPSLPRRVRTPTTKRARARRKRKGHPMPCRLLVNGSWRRTGRR